MLLFGIFPPQLSIKLLELSKKSVNAHKQRKYPRRCLLLGNRSLVLLVKVE